MIETSIKQTFCLKTRRFLNVCFIILMLIQIGFSFFWMIENYDHIPNFGDTGEYATLSITLQLDEYRPILYPICLRVARILCGDDYYYRIVFILQTLFSICCMTFAIYAVDAGRRRRKPSLLWKNILKWILCGLYLNSVPMITFMNFSIMTDSLANSFLVLMLSTCIMVIYQDKLNIWEGILIAISAICQSLLRSDRFYICIFLLVILFFFAVGKHHNYKKIIVLGTALILSVDIVFVSFINSKTQEIGRGGRIQTDFNFILLDRIVWPNMAANYDSFPNEIKENISREDAEHFDHHNNNVMYSLAPELEKKVGKEKAGEYYRIMAGIVWNNMPMKVLKRIFNGFVTVLTFPFSHYLIIHGAKIKGATKWNVKCMSGKTPALTAKYDDLAFFILIISLCLRLFIIIIEKLSKHNKKQNFVLLPYFIAALIINLWFTLGDGAHPNDRYHLIAFFLYTIFPLLSFRIYPSATSQLQ